MAKKKGLFKALGDLFKKNPENVAKRQEERTKRHEAKWGAKTVKWEGKFDPLSVQARAGAAAAWAEPTGQAISDAANAYMMSQGMSAAAGAGFDPSAYLATASQEPTKKEADPVLYAVGAAVLAVLGAALLRK